MDKPLASMVSLSRLVDSYVSAVVVVVVESDWTVSSFSMRSREALFVLFVLLRALFMVESKVLFPVVEVVLTVLVVVVEVVVVGSGVVVISSIPLRFGGLWHRIGCDDDPQHTVES